MVKQLQGGVSLEPLQADPDFVAMPPDLQAQYLAGEWLPKMDPSFNQLPTAELKQQYIQEEVLPRLTPNPIQPATAEPFQRPQAPGFNPLKMAEDGLREVNKGMTAATLFGGAVVDPFSDALTLGYGNSTGSARELARRNFPGIENDQGMLGAAYRFHQNPIANTIGSLAGMVAPTTLAEQAVARGFQAAGRFLLPRTTQLAQAAGVGAPWMRPALSAVSQLQGAGLVPQMIRGGAAFGAYEGLRNQPMEERPMSALGGAAMGAAFPPVVAGAGKVLQGMVRKGAPEAFDFLTSQRQAAEATAKAAKRGYEKRLIDTWQDLKQTLAKIQSGEIDPALISADDYAALAVRLGELEKALGSKNARPTLEALNAARNQTRRITAKAMVGAKKQGRGVERPVGVKAQAVAPVPTEPAAISPVVNTPIQTTPARGNKNYIGSIQKPKIKQTVSLSDAIADSLSRDYGGEADNLRAFDVLESMGYVIRKITKGKSTQSHGKQYSVTIGGKSYRFGQETLAGFMGKYNINSTTIAKGIQARGTFNEERVLSILPDSPKKTAYLEETQANRSALQEFDQVKQQLEEVNSKANYVLQELQIARTEEHLLTLERLAENPDFNYLSEEFSKDFGRIYGEAVERIYQPKPTALNPEASASPAGFGTLQELETSASKPGQGQSPSKTLTGGVREMAEKAAEPTGMTVDELLAAKPKDLTPQQQDIRANIKAVQNAQVVDEANGILRQPALNEKTDLQYEQVADLVEDAKVGNALEQAAKEGKAVRVEYIAEIQGRSDKAAKITAKGNVKVETTTFTPVSFGKAEKILNPEALPVNPKTGKPYGKDAKAVQELIENGTVKIKEFPVVRGYNERGHFVTYHINETPEGSQILKARASEKAPFVGEYANVYLGPRPFLAKDVLGRGVRSEAGAVLTSEAIALKQQTVDILKAIAQDESVPIAIRKTVQQLTLKNKISLAEIKSLHVQLKDPKQLKELEKLCNIMGLN